MRKVNTQGKCVAMVLIAVISSCGFGAQSSLKKECEPFIRPFFWMPLNKQVEDFSSRNLHVQHPLFVCGTKIIHPPAIYLARPYARNGASIITSLRSDLLNALDDLTVRYAILVFEEMRRQDTYDVVGDQELMNLLCENIKHMEDAEWRRMAQETFDAISKSRNP